MLPSHNSTFVRTNDSAYSNFSATVGERWYPSVRVLSRSAVNLEARSIRFRVNSLWLGERTSLYPRTRPETRGVGITVSS